MVDEGSVSEIVGDRVVLDLRLAGVVFFDFIWIGPRRRRTLSEVSSPIAGRCVKLGIGPAGPRLPLSPARGRLTETTYLDGRPDLAVEILTERNRGYEEVVKRHAYDRGSVAEYWIVDPEVESVKI